MEWVSVSHCYNLIFTLLRSENMFSSSALVQDRLVCIELSPNLCEGSPYLCRRLLDSTRELHLHNKETIKDTTSQHFTLNSKSKYT